MKSFPVIFLIAISFFIISCADIKPDAPEVEMVSGNLISERSELNLPILLEVSDLQELINQNIIGEIYKDSSFIEPKKDNLMFTISKIADIEMEVNGSSLYYSIPLNIWVKAKTPFGISTHTDFSLVLNLKSDLGVSQDWKPDIQTTFQSMKWVKKPSIRLGFLKIGVANLIEKILEEKIPDILSKVDGVLHQKLDIKTHAEKLWAGIQKPILINKPYQKVWLHTEPEQISLNQIMGNAGILTLNMTVSTYLKLVPKDTITDLKVRPLPNLLSQSEVKNTFDVNVLAKIPFSQINQVIEDRVVGKSFKKDGYEATVQKAELVGSKDRLILMVKLKGDVTGKVYFQGQPTYDSLTGELLIQQFDFDISTENVLAKSANWLLHDDFKKQIAQELHWPLHDYGQKLPELIQNGIANGKIGEKLSVTLDSFNIAPKQILITNQDLQVLIHATGNTKLEIANLML